MDKLEPTLNAPRLRSSTQTKGAGASSAPPVSARPQDSRSAQPYVPLADQPDTSKRRNRGLWVLGLLLAAGLAAGAFYVRNSSPSRASSAAGASSKAILQIAPADIDVEATALARQILAGENLTDESSIDEHSPAATFSAEVPTAEPAGAPASRTPQKNIPLPEARRKLVRTVLAHTTPAVRQEIAAGSQAIYRLHVLDNVVEDGDAVVLYANGVSYGRVDLTNRGESVLLALPTQALSQIRVLAVADGGGGVTFGASSSFGEVRSKVMAVGDSDNWTVVPR